MPDHTKSLGRRIQAQRLRVEELSSLRALVALPPGLDIGGRQWKVLESELKAVETRLLHRLNRGAAAYLSRPLDRTAARSLSALLGDIEMDLSRAFTFFDTFMDVLTQRHTPELGRLLAGCDVLALDSIRRAHPALSIVERPIVGCDRGFGARTFREFVRFPGGAVNPMPLIQIPYSRLKEKYNLTSILHEVGHEAMARCGLRTALPGAMRDGLAKAGAPGPVCDLYSRWSSEIGPDFWAFCGSGFAQAGGTKEILALPSSEAFRISWTDPHPPPYVRALLSFDWCRRQWGAGIWDKWRDEWLDLYPLDEAPKTTRDLLRQLAAAVPDVTTILFSTRFRSLKGKRISELFNLSFLAPSEVKRRIGSSGSGNLDLRGMPPSAHLAVFRQLKEETRLSEPALDNVMTHWLLKLAAKGKKPH